MGMVDAPLCSLISVSRTLRTKTMLKLTTALSLCLSVLIGCGELLLAAPLLTGVTSIPIYCQRLHRTRPLHNRDMHVYEIRELYYVRRTTSKSKPILLTDVEINQLIRCDFQPTLSECKKFSTTPKISRGLSSIMTTPTRATNTISTTSTIDTASKDLPLLPALSEYSSEFLELIETTSPEDEKDQIYHDDGRDEFDADDDENIKNDIDELIEVDDYVNSGGSIGGNDLSK